MRRAHAWVLVLMAGLLAGPPDAAAQERFQRPEVAVTLERAAPGAVLRLEIPAGWYVYAPDSEVGLPLELAWSGKGARAPDVAWDGAGERATAAGTARVFTETVHARVSGIGERPGEVSVRVRWAACRGDLCVPGVSEATLRSGPGR